MTTTDFSNKLNELIGRNEIQKTIEVLDNSLNRQSENYTTFLLIKSGYYQLKRETIQGIIDEPIRLQQNAKTRKALLDLSQILEETDIDPYKAVNFALPILIITSDKNNAAEIDTKFKRMGFADYTISTEIDNEKLKDVSIVVFDNRHLPICPKNAFENLPIEKKETVNQTIQQMDTVFSNSTAYIIHWGEYLFWLEGNKRERCQAANSQFTLFARIKEMKDFIDMVMV